jgi:hypothetical protein
MAIAPLNKFLTIAVPVAPGEQLIYSTPTGVSAILLYAQVSNVGVNTYPTVTFTHRRKSTASRTFGNTRNNRIIKNAEVPPSDSLIIIDGRLVLEKSAVVQDSILIEGTQAGIVSVTGCNYDNVTGVTTITTSVAHNFNVGDEVTMSGLAFTCAGSVGITTTIFPSPQQSFTIESIIGSVGTSKTFVTNSGIVYDSNTGLGITHYYNGGGLVGPLQMEFICSILENSSS